MCPQVDMEKAINSEFSIHLGKFCMFRVHVMYTLWQLIMLARLNQYKLCMFSCCIVLHKSLPL